VNAGTRQGAIAANVSNNERAIVTPGLANDVEAEPVGGRNVKVYRVGHSRRRAPDRSSAALKGASASARR
jgi:hypothetical protein